jgi:hypothetical protein
MRILLDECMPKAFRRALAEFEVETVRGMGWNGFRNGKLLAAMRKQDFAVLITVDKSLPLQQRLAAGGVAVIVLQALSNKFAILEALVPEVRRVLNHIQPGQVVWVPA